MHAVEEPQASVAPPESGMRLEASVFAPNPETLALLRACHAVLPDYEGSVAWVIASQEDVNSTDVPDLSVVLCERTTDLPAAVDLADTLARRGDTTILLVGKDVDASLAEVRGGLVVRAFGEDLAADLALLAHTVLAPAATFSWVCVDWADVLTILDDGREAILLGAAGTTRTEAIGNLLAAAAAKAQAPWFGACATMTSPLGASMAAYGPFGRAIEARMRADGFRLVAVPGRPVSREEVSLLALTKPSRRLEAKRASPAPT